MSETKGPRELREEAGTKYYCTCGKSKNFPYCDGSHEGTGKGPVKKRWQRNGRFGSVSAVNPPTCHFVTARTRHKQNFIFPIQI